MDNNKIEKNELLKQEFNNDVYNALGEAILETAQNHNYKKYDVAKLIMAIYDKKFDYITSTNDYRQQVILLDDYFTKTYDHRLITFEMLKTINSFKGTDKYKEITKDIANIESIIRNNKKVPAEDLNLISTPLDEENYDELMTKIENEKSFRYSLAVIYDIIKNNLK